MIPSKQMISNNDLYLFNEGNHSHLFRFMGAHPVIENNNIIGFHFAVWAPNAKQVFLTGDFNDWSQSSHPLYPLESSGIWTGFIPDLPSKSLYKFFIRSHYGMDSKKQIHSDFSTNNSQDQPPSPGLTNTTGTITNG